MQSAFSRIVRVVDECSCSGKPETDSEIKIVSEEIIKSKIRDKILLESRSNINQKLSKLQLNEDDDELKKLRVLVAEQATSIKNQSKYLTTLFNCNEAAIAESDKLNKRIVELEEELLTLKKEVADAKEKNVVLKRDLENSIRENERLIQRNEELLARLGE